MRFKVLITAFVDAIDNVSRALSTKTPMPILKAIKLDVTEEGIYLTASNANITIKQFLSATQDGKQIMDIEETGSAAIPGRLLFEVLRKAHEEYVELALFEDKVVKITFGNSEYTLNCFDVREYPNITLINSEEPIIIKARELFDVINQTVISVSTNESRPILTGVNVVVENDELVCVATDSYRLSRKIVTLNQGPTEPVNIIVPGKSLQELSRILDDFKEDVEVHITPNMIAFKFDHLIFQSRLISGKYPDTKRLIPEKFGLELTINRSDLIDVIDRVSLLSREGASNIIKFDIYEDKTIVSLDSPEIGKVTEEIIPKHQSGSLIRIGFNSKYLLDALRVLDDEEVTLKFTGEVRPFIIETSDVTVTQLILPVRIE
mgnify:FL=1